MELRLKSRSSYFAVSVSFSPLLVLSCTIPPELLRCDCGTSLLEFSLSLYGTIVPFAQEIPHPSGTVSGTVPDFLEVRMLSQLRLTTTPLPCAFGPGIGHRAYIGKQAIGTALSVIGDFPFEN